jgi:hypothetical protein
MEVSDQLQAPAALPLGRMPVEIPKTGMEEVVKRRISDPAYIAPVVQPILQSAC